MAVRFVSGYWIKLPWKYNSFQLGHLFISLVHEMLLFSDFNCMCVTVNICISLLRHTHTHHHLVFLFSHKDWFLMRSSLPQTFCCLLTHTHTHTHTHTLLHFLPDRYVTWQWLGWKYKCWLICLSSKNIVSQLLCVTEKRLLLCSFMHFKHFHWCVYTGFYHAAHDKKTTIIISDWYSCSMKKVRLIRVFHMTENMLMAPECSGSRVVMNN